MAARRARVTGFSGEEVAEGLACRASLVQRLALAFGLVHAVVVLVFAAFILALSIPPVAQWQMGWAYLEPIDWPVSQLLRWEGWPRGPYLRLPYPLQDPIWFAVPVFVFGAAGSAWYAIIGAVVGLVAERARQGRRSE